MIIGIIVFALCSHLILIYFKEVTEHNYGESNLNDFVINVNCEEECFYQNEKLNYTISPVAGLGSQKFSVSITYDGKTYEHTYDLEVIDKINPTITLTTEKVEIIKDSEFNALAYILEVTDNYDELTEEVQVESELDTTKVGSYEVTYILSDSNKNIETFTLIVEVEELEADKEDNDTTTDTDITFNASRKQNYTLEILKDDEVISSESYDGSSKSVTLDFSDVGDAKYDVRIYLSVKKIIHLFLSLKTKKFMIEYRWSG